mmetsp:Transcript_42016/g.105412  ORF Transcript_42016/g.105412 Transcript_42016/m.105412 type:complete len:493 (-) Transcript_42016:328-1806(-)
MTVRRHFPSALAGGLLLLAAALNGVTGLAPPYAGQKVPPFDPETYEKFMENDTILDGPADLSAMSSCGGSWSRPGGISSSAPSYLDRRQKALADDYYDQATDYGDRVRALMIGDSLLEYLREDGDDCDQDIFEDHFDRKGFNWGIAGTRTDYTKTMTDWIFRGARSERKDIKPQVVYLSVGVNDCIYEKRPRDISDNIIDIVKIIKYYSPDTRVVIQEILPTSFYDDKDDDDHDGERWERAELYKCITDTNKLVKAWVRSVDRYCIETADLSDLVLDNDGEFKGGVLRDGLHFGSRGIFDHCRAIQRSIRRFSGVQINSASAVNVTIPIEEDVEPLHYPSIEGNATIFRWRYNDWSACSGACGIQRRTAECHKLILETEASEVVDEALCAMSFMHPVDRVCNVEPSCVASLGPGGTLPRYLVPADQLLVTEVPSSDPDCDTASDTDNAYLGAIAALAAVLLITIVAAVIMSMRLARATKMQPAGKAVESSAI